MMINRRGFFLAMLKELGLSTLPSPARYRRLTFFLAWSAAESGFEPCNGSSGARFNPLNTTQGPGTNYNSVGVKNFATAYTGQTNTVATLHNGYYPMILAPLKTGRSALDMAHGVAHSPWGTGHGAETALAGMTLSRRRQLARLQVGP